VRSNRDGVLWVPAGYVGALQCDPIEKKPFFHALPGSDALSFGMLGCDYHCSYCFTGDTRVITDRGVVRIDSLFPEEGIPLPGGGQAGKPDSRQALTHTGAFAPIQQVFAHPHDGPVIEVTPFYLPAFRCTPEHRVLATTQPESEPEWIPAHQLSPRHFLSIPKPVVTATGPGVIDVQALLSSEVKSRAISQPERFLVPIKQVEVKPYQGNVFNLEVAGAHTYTANFFAVHNCQNWITSQALRDPAAVSPARPTTPEELVAMALAAGAPVIASTYNEPLITSEWAVEIFRHAQAHGLMTAYISNGNATPRVLDYLRPWVDLYKVDLKGFDDRRYHELGGVLKTVQETIVNLKERGFWLEVVTLIIPGFNDTDVELTALARFLASVDRTIPWHVTAFHRDYKLTDPPDTGVETLLRAAAIGRTAGLQFVYAGNRPGQVGDLENTRCPGCGALLIERQGYLVRRNRITGGSCPDCGEIIPGRWARPDQPPYKSEAAGGA
jgi:pyruvate formate lyase activating enzyme